MQKKKSWVRVFSLIVLLAVVVLLAGMFGWQRLQEKQIDEKYISKSESGDITRYEWIQQLTEQYGLTEYNEETPYFKDVASDNTYFAAVQSAVEWKVLKTGEVFEGDAYATGRFAALTAMRVVGQSKLQMYADTNKEFSDRKLLDIAISEGLIEEEFLTEGISEKESQQILNRLNELYYGLFSPEDYCEVTYQKGTVELGQSDLSVLPDQGNEIVISENIAKNLQAGSVIIYEDSISVKHAAKVKAVHSDGTIEVEAAKPEEFLESLKASGQKTIDFNDMLTYCRLTDADLADRADSLTVQPMCYDMTDHAHLLSTGEDKALFTLNLKSEEDDGKTCLNVTLENKKGQSFELSLPDVTDDSIALEDGEAIEAELSVNRFAVSAQSDYKLSQGLQYAEVAVDVNSTMKGNVSVTTEKKIPLIEIPIPLAGGVMKVDVQINLVVGMDGSLELQAELPMQGAVRYEKGVGLRKHSLDINVEEPSFKADCEINLILRTEPVLSVLGCNLLDAEADVGMCTTVETVVRENGQVCMDVSSAYPTVTLSVLGDEEADSLLAEFGISVSWELIKADRAPFQFTLHFERLSDGNSQFVEKCTYKEEEENEPEQEEVVQTNEDSKSEKHTYATKLGEINLITCPKFSFDYPDGWTITSEDYPKPGAGVWDQQVILANDRGVQITFTSWTVDQFGGGGRFMDQYELSKVADSAFVPFYPAGTDKDLSYLGPFMVARVKGTGSMFMDEDEDFTPIDGKESYAVLPESYAGTKSVVGDSGYMEMLWFEYPQPISFIAESPDGHFLEDEKKEVIEILSSFRVE